MAKPKKKNSPGFGRNNPVQNRNYKPSPTPRIDRMQNRGMTKDEIRDTLNGPNNQRDLTYQQLKAIGYNPERIQRLLSNQNRATAPSRGGSSGGGGTNPSNGDGDHGDDGPGLGQNPQDYFDWLDEQQQAIDLATKESAFKLFKKQLEAWGIPVGADIESIIRQAAMEGIGPDQIGLVIPEIQDTQTWRNRFPGWHKRVQNGYNQLSVGEYLALEDSYHRIMQEAGLPAGFYDDPSDFGNWIAGNVSPDEIKDRVDMAMGAVRQVDPTARDLLKKFYGVGPGDLASYFLDQKRALPVLDRQFKAANVASFAAKAGLRVGDAKRYEDLVDKGVTADAAAQGYNTVAAFNEAFGRLAGVYGESYTQEDAEEDVFFNRNDKRRKLMAKELSAFSGSSRGMTGKTTRSSAY